jgi:hypothetical protein
MQNAVAGAEAARKDFWTAVILIGITALGFVSLYGDAETLTADFGADPGPDFLPRLLLSVLGLCALWFCAASALRLVRLGAWPLARIRAGRVRAYFFPVLMIASLLVYLQIMPRTGFVPATAGFALLWLVLIGIQEDGRPTLRRLALYTGEAAAITALVYIVFAKLILVVLP